MLRRKIELLRETTLVYSKRAMSREIAVSIAIGGQSHCGSFPEGEEGENQRFVCAQVDALPPNRKLTRLRTLSLYD